MAVDFGVVCDVVRSFSTTDGGGAGFDDVARACKNGTGKGASVLSVKDPCAVTAVCAAIRGLLANPSAGGARDANSDEDEGGTGGRGIGRSVEPDRGNVVSSNLVATSSEIFN